MIKGTLLIRESDFQYFLANILYEKKIIDCVIIEKGSSLNSNLKITFKKIILNLKLLSNFFNLFFKIHQIINYEKFYGNRKYHNERILGYKKVKLNKNIKVIKTENINNFKLSNYIKNKKNNFVLVFGTRVIKIKHLRNFKNKFINIHWGYSPDYRGEGIVTCLAKNDIKKLGVTIHEIGNKIDLGKIIERKIVKLDSNDNFYSIGLKMTVAAKNIICDKTFSFKINNSLHTKKKGEIYDSNYIKKNYKDYYLAFKNLKKFNEK